MESFWDIFQPELLIRYGGLAIIVLIVFIENGLFFGFFLPGDSLLFAAGLLCYIDVLDVDLAVLISSIGIAAVFGYYAGYYFGFKTGQALYKRKDSFFFKRSYIDSAEHFYQKYGGMALILGRFLPIIRTFAPILAGVVRVNHRTFFLYNITGAFLWPGVVVTSGYYIGYAFPQALDYLNYIIIAFIVVTAIPVINGIREQRKKKKAALENPDDTYFKKD